MATLRRLTISIHWMTAYACIGTVIKCEGCNILLRVGVFEIKVNSKSKCAKRKQTHGKYANHTTAFCNSDPRIIHRKELQFCCILALIHDESEHPSPKLSRAQRIDSISPSLVCRSWADEAMTQPSDFTKRAEKLARKRSLLCLTAQCAHATLLSQNSLASKLSVAGW